jgi:uncharacterized protein YuzE
MDVKIDDHKEAVYIVLNDQTVAESREVCPGIIIDYDQDGEIAGLEVIPDALAGKTQKAKGKRPDNQ